MNWTEVSKSCGLLKNEVEEKFIGRYNHKDEDGAIVFQNDYGIEFGTFLFEKPEVCIGIEYHDTWEDGDLFYPSDYKSLDDMVKDIEKEIDSATPEE